MSALTLLGIASMAFVLAFTLHRYRAGRNPRRAIVEAWANLVVGFGINFIANFAILPLVGASFTAAENWWLGWLYTAVSVVRQYSLRVTFERVWRC